MVPLSSAFSASFRVYSVLSCRRSEVSSTANKVEDTHCTLANSVKSSCHPAFSWVSRVAYDASPVAASPRPAAFLQHYGSMSWQWRFCLEYRKTAHPISSIRSPHPITIIDICQRTSWHNRSSFASVYATQIHRTTNA